MKQKRSIVLLLAWIIGLAYAIYIVTYFAGSIAAQNDPVDGAATVFAAALVLPHMVVTFLAVVFNFLGWFFQWRWSALTGGILYGVAMLLFLLYFWGVAVEMILSFVGFAQMKNIQRINQA
jgi:hypothetical protein